MKLQWIILTVVVVLGVAGAAVLLSLLPPREPASATGPGVDSTSARPVVLGLLAEHDVLDQRQRVRALTAWLSDALGRPVEFVTENRYEPLYGALRAGRVDIALLPAMPALGATIHCDAQLVAYLERPRESLDVAEIFVAASSSCTGLESLRGGSIALVRGCCAGELYPRYELQRCGLDPGGSGPRVVWASTHAEVIRLVADGETDAGSTWQRHVRRFASRSPEHPLRTLAVSDPLPGPVVLAQAGFAAEHGDELRTILLSMRSDAEGREALAALDASGFGSIESAHFDEVRRMAREVDELRELLGLTAATEVIAPPVGTDGR